MASIQNDARLFGLDLSDVFDELKVAWREMASWRVFAWLRPQPPVRWLRADGTAVLCRGASQESAPSAAALQAACFDAIEAPEELLLRRTVGMPVLPAVALQGALALEVQNLSPFPLEDLLWVSVAVQRGADATVEARSFHVVLTSRALLQAHLNAAAPAGNSAVEVWVSMGDKSPVVLPGFGEPHRLRHERRGQSINFALLGVLGVLTAALLITPTAQLRQRALDALSQYEALQKEVAPLVRQREAFVKNEALLQSLHAAAGQAPSSVLQAMEVLTKALPDDTFLQSFQVLSPEGAGKPPKVVLVGQTANAAALMQLLGGQPGVRDVKAPNAAVKPLGATKESFTIELAMDLAAPAGVAEPVRQDAAAPAPPLAGASAPAPAASGARP